MARHAQSGTKAGEGNIVDGILRVLKRLSPYGRTYFQMRWLDESPGTRVPRGRGRVRGRMRPKAKNHAAG